MSKGFLFRRFGCIIPCILRLSNKKYIKLNDKHSISSFQDVFLNPFYWDALLVLNFTPKNVFDLGANFGLFSSLCQQVFAYKSGNQETTEYTLIEANQNLAKKLKRNIDNLIPGAKAKVKFGAAGPKEDVYFSANKNNLLASRISKEGVRVPFIDFNTLEKPDLLKIDIEGAEALLFENYFFWIKSAKAIIIEFHYEGTVLKNNLSQLRGEGFELKLDKLERSGYRNQLWVKKEF